MENKNQPDILSHSGAHTQEILYSSDGVAADLHSHLSRIAVLHPVAENSSWQDPAENADSYQDPYTNRLTFASKIAQRSTDEGLPPNIEINETTPEKQAALSMIRTAILEAHQRTQGRPSSTDHVDWADITDTLLQSSAEAAPDIRPTQLVAASVAIHFAKSPLDRKKFLETLTTSGLLADMATACEASHLVVLLPQNEPRSANLPRAVHVASLARVFSTKPDTMGRYLSEFDPRQQRQSASPKRLQKEIVERLENGSTDPDASAEAEIASLETEKTKGSLLDMYKIERFGLEQYFIKRQMAAVLAGPDIGHTAFQAELMDKTLPRVEIVTESDTRARTGPSFPPGQGLQYCIANSTAQLENDIEAAFRTLSAPVVDAFRVDESIMDITPDLTREQAATIRFRQIKSKIGDHMAVARFLDIEHFIDQTQNEIVNLFEGTDQLAEGDDPLEIWTVAQDGAAVSDICERLLSNVLQSCTLPGAATDVAAEELRDFLHANRRNLLRAATHHIAEFMATTNRQEPAPQPIQRDEGGSLTLPRLGIESFPKNSLDFYAAVALGCPALREIHQNRAEFTAEEKLAYGSSNYIDHILAAVINEAYSRGILDIASLTKRAADLNARNQPIDNPFRTTFNFDEV